MKLNRIRKKQFIIFPEDISWGRQTVAQKPHKSGFETIISEKISLYRKQSDTTDKTGKQSNILGYVWFSCL